MSSSVTAKKGSSKQTNKKSASVELETLRSDGDRTVNRVNVNDEVFLTIIYTGGEKEGQVKYRSLSEKKKKKSNKDSTDVSTSDISTSDVDLTTDADADVIVDRYESVGGELGEECGYDYCDGFKYEHGYGGVTFELTEDADFWGTNSLTAAIITILKSATKYNPSSWVISSAISYIISNLTGNEYTLMTKDYDGLFGPEMQRCVAAKWDADPDDVSQYLLATGHLGGQFNSTCGD